MAQGAFHEPAPAERARLGRRNVDCRLSSIVIRNPELANDSVAGTATLRLAGNMPVPGMTQFMAPKQARKRIEATHEPPPNLQRFMAAEHGRQAKGTFQRPPRWH